MWMQTANLNVCTDYDLKNQAESIFNELGLTMTTAINIFLRASVRVRGIPFSLILDSPSDITKAAIAEGRRLARDPQAKGYKNMADLKAALEA